MTDWFAEVEISHPGSVDDERTAALMRALPGFTIVKHDAELGRTTAIYHVDAPTVRSAVDAALRTWRDATRAVSGTARAADAVSVRPVDWVEYPSPLELVGTAEAADIIGVTRQRVEQLADTDETFPHPIARLRAGNIYTKASIDAYARRRTSKPGRPRKTA